jgi:hypothetical protein
MNESTVCFRFFAELADVFEARFMRPLWRRYPDRDSDDFDSLGLFLDGYAFARQGARPDFAHVAVDIVKELKIRGQSLTADNTAQLAWDMFCTRLRNEDLNQANNPLCPLGTNYNRQTGPSVTNSHSIFEFLRGLRKFEIAPNIVSFVRYHLKANTVGDAHKVLCTINGIGTKIASLFLRDVAKFDGVFPSNDRILLQPVDVWIKRITSYLFGRELSGEEIQKLIVEHSLANGIVPEAVNEGMWYFGSEITDSNYRMQSALNSLTYVKTLAEEHVRAISDELSAWDRGIRNGNLFG